MPPLLLVVNKGNRTLQLLDPDAARSLGVVALSGVTGHEVAVSPDGRRAFVPIYSDTGVGQPGSDGRTIDVVDLAARRVVATWDLGRPERPHAAHFAPDGRHLLVSTELSQTITLVDTDTGAVVGRAPTGQPESHMFTMTRDGRTAFTSNVGAGTVSVVDLRERRVDAVIPVCRRAQRIALSADERWVFTSDQDAPRLAVIDAAARTFARWVPLPGVAYATVPTPDGRFLVVVLRKSDAVCVLDLQTMDVVAALAVPPSPQFALVRPDGRRAYVSCSASAAVVALDTAGWTIAATLAAGRGADGLAWCEHFEYNLGHA